MVPPKHEQCSAWRQGNLTAWMPLKRHIGFNWNLANSLIESCVASLKGLGKYMFCMVAPKFNCMGASKIDRLDLVGTSQIHS